MENNNINNTDVNITEEVQEKKEDLKIIKLKPSQLEILKEWLLLAVVEAEKKLGGGTGQIKLRYVYDMFIEKFKFLALMITFEQFSIMVDMALDKMRLMLSSNEKLKDYVEK